MWPVEPPLVLHRSRAWRLKLRAWRFVIALSALSLVWSTQDLSLPGPLRWTLVGAVALLAVRPSRDLSRTVSIDDNHLERGSSRWAWVYLTSVQLGPCESPPQGPSLGSVTLHFSDPLGDKAVSFGREWPLEELLEAVLSRAPLKTQLEQARERLEREHGLSFGAIRLEPSSLEHWQGGKPVRRAARTDVRDVSLELSAQHATMRIEVAGWGTWHIPLVELRDPHVLAALLVGHEVELKHSAPAAPPPAKTSRESGAWRALPTTYFVVLVGLTMGVMLFYLSELAREGWDSYGWQPVPAEIVTSRTWEHHPIPNRTTTEREGAITYRFVFNGVSHTAERFAVDGTSAREAEKLVPGQRVTAYVPPEHPERAVLDPGLPFRELVIGGVVVLPLLVLTMLHALTTIAKLFGWKWWPFTFDARARGRS